MGMTKTAVGLETKGKGKRKGIVMKSYDTYIFDLDGTLLDTLDDLAAAVNHVMRTFRWPEHSRDAVRRMVGNGVRVLMERAVPGGADNAQLEAALAAFRSYYLQHSMDTTRPYYGITDMLQELKARGCRTAVVSNKFDAATKQLCAYYFGTLIDVAVGEHEAEGIRKKPAPDTVVEALRQLGVDGDGAVYVGDSDVDVATARNSHLPCISVLWGFRDREFLAAHGATTFVDTPQVITQLSQDVGV